MLSKCDKIRDSLEYEVMEKIDLTSAQFKEFPYKYVYLFFFIIVA